MPMISANSWWLLNLCHICPIYVLRNWISMAFYLCYTPMNLGLSDHIFPPSPAMSVEWGKAWGGISIDVHFTLDFYSQTGALHFHWVVLQLEFYTSQQVGKLRLVDLLHWSIYFINLSCITTLKLSLNVNFHNGLQCVKIKNE